MQPSAQSLCPSFQTWALHWADADRAGPYEPLALRPLPCMIWMRRLCLCVAEAPGRWKRAETADQRKRRACTCIFTSISTSMHQIFVNTGMCNFQGALSALRKVQSVLSGLHNSPSQHSLHLPSPHPLEPRALVPCIKPNV